MRPEIRCSPLLLLGVGLGFEWPMAGALVFAIASNGHREHWGFAHISLQPLVLLGLAFRAARWPVLGRRSQLALVADATADSPLGIAFRFGMESHALDRRFAAGRAASDTLTSNSGPALPNLSGKVVRRLEFVRDVTAPAPVFVFALLAAIMWLALGPTGVNLWPRMGT
jgi:hypothetical protein